MASKSTYARSATACWLDAGELERLPAAQASARESSLADAFNDGGASVDLADAASEGASSIFDFLGDLFSGF